MHHFATKVRIVKVKIFPVATYRCESWNVKKTELWRIDAFKLPGWKRLLRVPWTTRRSNQSILEEIDPEYLLEGLMLKLLYFSHLMQRADSLEKTLILGKIEGRRRSAWKRMRWLDSITNSMDMNLSKLQEILEDRGAWHAQGCKELDMTKWTITNNRYSLNVCAPKNWYF